MTNLAPTGRYSHEKFSSDSGKLLDILLTNKEQFSESDFKEMIGCFSARYYFRAEENNIYRDFDELYVSSGKFCEDEEDEEERYDIQFNSFYNSRNNRTCVYFEITKPLIELPIEKPAADKVMFDLANKLFGEWVESLNAVCVKEVPSHGNKEM